MNSLADFRAHIAIWGWSVLGSGGDPRQAVRDCHVANLGESRHADDGWWDATLPELWLWEITRPDGTREAPPWRMALAGWAY